MRPASRSSTARRASSPTSSPRQVALHAPAGGIVPEVAARAHLRWIVPVLDEAWADAGVVVGRHRVGRRHVRTGARRLAAGRDQLRESPRLGPRTAVGRGQPSRGARLRGVAARSRRGRRRPSRSFRSSRSSSRGGHTFLAEMTDHLTYRLLGATVDDAAGEAFDKVGRLLGLGYPGGPAISGAAEARPAHDRVFPRAWLGDTYDFSFSGLKTAARRIVDEARADAGSAGRRPGRAACRDARRRRARLGLPGRGRRRARDEDDPRRQDDRRAVDRARRWRRREHAPCATRLAGEAEALGLPLDRAPARPCAPTTGR